MKKIRKLIVLVLLALSLPILMSASYNYSYYGNVVYSSPGYTFAHSYNYSAIGLDPSSTSPEYFVVHNDEIYLIDSGTSELIVIDESFSLKEKHKTFNWLNSSEEPVTLSKPEGLDIKEDAIYIADTGNKRIVKLNHDYQVLEVFKDPEDPVFEDREFRPSRITVDEYGTMYVIVKHVFEGIVELSNKGEFNRFVGVNPIKLSAIEIFRRSLMTEKQKSQLVSFLPTEYTAVNINKDSFIYATSKQSSDSNENMIQLINPKGIDVLNRTGYFAPMGDVHFLRNIVKHLGNDRIGPSRLADIDYTESGIFSVLDSHRSRVFTYDSEGNLLYIIDSAGTQKDKFKNGSSLKYIGDNLVVLDKDNKNFLLFELTEFGKKVNLAVKYHNEGEFELAEEVWLEVIELNNNYEIAYNGVGKSLLRKGEYKEAMEYFKIGHDKYYYSKAYKEYRNEILIKNFGYIILGIVGISAFFIGRTIYKKRKKGESLLYEE